MNLRQRETVQQKSHPENKKSVDGWWREHYRSTSNVHRVFTIIRGRCRYHDVWKCCIPRHDVVDVSIQIHKSVWICTIPQIDFQKIDGDWERAIILSFQFFWWFLFVLLLEFQKWYLLLTVRCPSFKKYTSLTNLRAWEPHYHYFGRITVLMQW